MEMVTRVQILDKAASISLSTKARKKVLFLPTQVISEIVGQTATLTLVQQ